MILSIDPGNFAGWAITSSRDGELEDCGLGDSLALLSALRLTWSVDLVIIEIPKIRQGGPTEQIIKLSMTAGRLVQAVRDKIGNVSTYGVFPETWKGQVPKATHNDRVLGHLSKRSRELFCAKRLGKSDDVIDAIGIGQWCVPRVSLLSSLVNYQFSQVGWAT